MPNQKKVPKSENTLEHERLTSLINTMADGVITTDEQGKIGLYNGVALNILDRNSPIRGKKLSEVMKVVNKNNQGENIDQLVLKTKTSTINRDLKLEYSDGSHINLYLNIAPVHLGFGKSGQGGFVLIMRDITREKSLEEERDEFISVASHELRTPVAIAEGNVGNAVFIAEKTGNLIQIKEALKQAHEQITFLSGLINDLATLSRAERGKLTAEIEPINAYELIEDLVKNYQEQADAKGIKLQTDLDPHLELLQSSKLYVREILQNFITNAIKYTEKGSVTIGAQAKPEGVMFSVRDTGIGIGKGDQEKVFDKFFRSEDFRTRQNSGTGLGLYVTMKLARLLHADIDVESELNKGSAFTVMIPNLQ